MANILVIVAANWNNTAVTCDFAVTANGVPAKPRGSGTQIYDLPPGTNSVHVTATPTPPRGTTEALFWGDAFDLSVSASGDISAKPGPRAVLIDVFAALKAFLPVTLVTLRLNRFKEVTDAVANLLANPPASRATYASSPLVAQYGATPNSLQNLPATPHAHVLDVANPINGGKLSFKPATGLSTSVDNIALELAGGTTPRLYGVTLPKSPTLDKEHPFPILLFLRQTSFQNTPAKFRGPDMTAAYPYNFDYAERCLYESMNYGVNGPFSKYPTTVQGYDLRPKGVPYQAAAAGSKAVIVYPCTRPGATKVRGLEFLEFNETQNIGRILGELQAFVFWKNGKRDLPANIGSTAIAAFSSTNHVVFEWLSSRDNVHGSFLGDRVKAIYLLDPGEPEEVVDVAIKWMKTKTDKKLRLYVRGLPPQVGYKQPAHEMLLGTAAPASPFIFTSPDKKRTVALLRLKDWQQTISNSAPGAWPDEDWDAHHLIAATMLVHALAQNDLP